MEKVIRDGKVAVLYSVGYGAGWKTWNDDKKTWMLFHPELVAAVESGNCKEAGMIAERIGKEKYGNDDYTCVLGSDGLSIEWIEEGAQFDVEEYDGSESIHLIGTRTYFTA